MGVALHLSLPLALVAALVACATTQAGRSRGWTSLDRGALHLEVPVGLKLVEVSEGRFRLGQDRFFSILAGNDGCLLLRFFSLTDDRERIDADRLAASVRWTATQSSPRTSARLRSASAAS